jgi:hypothetical protein
VAAVEEVVAAATEASTATGTTEDPGVATQAMPGTATSSMGVDTGARMAHKALAGVLAQAGGMREDPRGRQQQVMGPLT